MKKKKFKKADDFPFCFSTNFFHFSYEFSIFLRKKMCSTPVVSTIYEKSELFPNRGYVRIFHFYQGYYILSRKPGGFL